MCMPMPEGDYQFETDIERFTEEYILAIPEDGILENNKHRGYLFDIDGYYPNEVHDLLDNYVPLPENKAHEPSPNMKDDAKRDAETVKSTRKVRMCPFSKNKLYSPII